MLPKASRAFSSSGSAIFRAKRVNKKNVDCGFNYGVDSRSNPARRRRAADNGERRIERWTHGY
jgi:hypothetical protein